MATVAAMYPEERKVDRPAILRQGKVLGWAPAHCDQSSPIPCSYGLGVELGKDTEAQLANPRATSPVATQHTLLITLPEGHTDLTTQISWPSCPSSPYDPPSHEKNSLECEGSQGQQLGMPDS